MKNILLCVLCVLCACQVTAQVTAETFSKEYEGNIGQYKIHMFLLGRFGTVTGHYYYERHKGENEISLVGTKKGANIVLYEDLPSEGETGESFNGKFINDSTIKGIWTLKGKKLNFALKEKKSGINYPRTVALKDLKIYAGLDPWESKFFEQNSVSTEIKKIMGKDYIPYLKLLGRTAYVPQFNLENGLLTEGFWIEHIGCEDQTMMAIDISTNSFYICWVKDGVDDIVIYHDHSKPIPHKVLEYFNNTLNSSWGHAYTFSISGDKIIGKQK